jgi:hypothetical protein
LVLSNGTSYIPFYHSTYSYWLKFFIVKTPHIKTRYYYS